VGVLISESKVKGTDPTPVSHVKLVPRVPLYLRIVGGGRIVVTVAPKNETPVAGDALPN
jgi:hypothetical protein